MQGQQLRIAELELERVKVLVDKKVIVKSELDLGKARVADAQAKVAEALTAVDDAQTKISYLLSARLLPVLLTGYL